MIYVGEGGVFFEYDSTAKNGYQQRRWVLGKTIKVKATLELTHLTPKLVLNTGFTLSSN